MPFTIKSKMSEEFNDPDWEIKYREYMDKKYFELSEWEIAKPISKLELLMLGAVRVQVGNRDLFVVTLPYHSDNPFVFMKEETENYFKW